MTTNDLITIALPIAEQTARRFASRRHPVDELISDCLIPLYRAAETWDSALGSWEARAATACRMAILATMRGGASAGCVKARKVVVSWPTEEVDGDVAPLDPVCPGDDNRLGDVLAAIDQLPAGDADLVRARFWGGVIPAQDGANIRLSRALGKIRKIVGIV